MRVLIAEDEAYLNRILEKMLTKAGYAVDSCADGQEALEYLESTDAYDAAILDIMMPRVDGLTVLRRIRERGSDLPVLLLTARDAVESRVEGLDLGADDYLTKPFATQELLRACGHCCAGVEPSSPRCWLWRTCAWTPLPGG